MINTLQNFRDQAAAIAACEREASTDYSSGFAAGLEFAVRLLDHEMGLVTPPDEGQLQLFDPDTVDTITVGGE